MTPDDNNAPTLRLHASVASCESLASECEGEQLGRCTGEQIESVLQELPGSTENDRLLVIHVERCDGSVLVLRQQNRGAGIGWFTQSSVEINAGQLGPLKLALQASPRLSSSGKPHPLRRPRFKVVS